MSKGKSVPTYIIVPLLVVCHTRDVFPEPFIHVCSTASGETCTFRMEEKRGGGVGEIWYLESRRGTKEGDG